MKKINARSVASVSLLVLALFFFGGCSKPEPLEPYIVPVFVSDSSGQAVGFANATLVDKTKGLFATNAHVVAAGENFRLRIGDQWRPAETRKDWINWEADLAILKLADPFPGSLPEPPGFSRDFSKDSRVVLKGYVLGSAVNVIKPYPIESKVTSVESGWNITIPSRLEKVVIQIMRMNGKRVPKEKLHVLYEHYILIETKDESWKFLDGLSGSPVLAENGETIGIISSSTDYQALIVPSFEIENLLEKVNASK